jgi:thiamine-phosphate pyrophosphorylase
LSSAPRAAPRLYLITDRTATAGRPLLDVVRAALAGRSPQVGDVVPAVAVQLREKDLPGRALFELARALRTITRDAGAWLFVNDRLDVALAAGADGVHLGGGSLPIADVRALAPRLRIGVSTHARADVERAARGGASFVVFGPVFDTPSKRALGSPLGLHALSDACAVGVPVLALGGVTPENAPACVGVGAAGVACIRPVMCATNPSAVVDRFVR